MLAVNHDLSDIPIADHLNANNAGLTVPCCTAISCVFPLCANAKIATPVVCWISVDVVNDLIRAWLQQIAV